MSTESEGVQSGFTRHGNNYYVANFSPSESEVLINLVEQILELLGERTDNHSDDPLAAMVGITSHDSPPEDEVLLRLLPNAYADQVDASEFRRYTELDLRTKKSAAWRLRVEAISLCQKRLECAWRGKANLGCRSILGFEPDRR